MAGAVTRYAEIILRAGVDHFAGGLREVYQGISEERARLFVEWLGSNSERRRLAAETALSQMVSSPKGAKILRHVCRDVLFGTEAISLAALSVVTAEASAKPDDPFWARAANSVDGLQDEVAIGFVSLIRHIGDFHVEREWMSICHFDVAQLAGKDHWIQLRDIMGIGDVEIYCAISEAVQRRLLIPDTDRGRMGSVHDVAPRTFFLSGETARYFHILGRAIEMANPDVFRLLAPLNFETVEKICGVS